MPKLSDRREMTCEGRVPVTIHVPCWATYPDADGEPLGDAIAWGTNWGKEDVWRVVFDQLDAALQDGPKGTMV